MTLVTLRRLGALLLCLVAALVAPASAQGVTTAALNGTVTDAAGGGLPGASVLAVHEPSGTRYGIATRADGQYNLRNLRVGGPYTVTVSFVGFQTEQRTGLQLALSQDLTADFALADAAAELGEATVVGRDGSLITSSNVGTGTNVSTEQIERLPTITRSLTDFTRLTPQFAQVGTGSEAGSSVGGTSSRYNNIQVDGAALNDAFGLESSGTPGGSSGTQPISLDAVGEFRVAIAPYDVTQGGFTGGNINVITRSGTNAFEGSAYVLGRNQSLVGDDFDGNAFDDFSDYTVGARLGGPVLRDKLFFFGSAEFVDTNEPVLAGFAGDAGNVAFNAPREDVAEIQQILNDTYDRPTGSLDAFDASTVSTKLFGRLDYNLSQANKLTARFNFVQRRKGRRHLARNRTFYTLEDRLYTRQNTNTSSVVELRSDASGRTCGQPAPRLSFQTNRQPSVLEFPAFPSVEIRGLQRRRPLRRWWPARTSSAPPTTSTPTCFEFTNNFNYFVGDHVVTLGTQNTVLQLREPVHPQLLPATTAFNNAGGLPQRAQASLFERNYSAIPGEDRPVAAFSLRQLQPLRPGRVEGRRPS